MAGLLHAPPTPLTLGITYTVDVAVVFGSSSFLYLYQSMLPSGIVTASKSATRVFPRYWIFRS